MPAAFDSERSWAFELSAEDLWERISAVDDYPTWWPWLRRFEPASGLVPGARWRCEVAPPLPYLVRFTLRIDRVVAHRVVEASVTGDIRGWARLTLEPDPAPTTTDTTSATLVSRLAPAHPLLRGVGRVARPVVEWGHEWVLDQGRQQFISRALGDTGTPEQD